MMTNSETLSLRKQLKQLKIEKGIASKAVGKAKVLSKPIQPFIEEVQRISKQINNCEKEIKNSLTQHIDQTTNSYAETVIPSQFKDNQLIAGASSYIEIIANITEQQWDGYVNQHPNATIYHTSAIRRVIDKTFGHQSHYLAAVNLKTQELLGVLPLIEMKSLLFGHFMVSLPFFNYGGLLASTEAARKELLNHALEIARKLSVQHIEYRHSVDNLELPCKSEKVAMVLSLPKTQDELWAAIGTKVRAQIKRAMKHQLEIKSGRSEMVDHFYQVFCHNMRDLGTPVYPKSLFHNMIHECPDAQIINVYINGQPVSSGFVLGWRDSLEIPWASTLKKANKYDANMLLYWEILKYAISKGYKTFDFGRSSKNSNTFRFKKQWGALPHELYWHYSLPSNHDLPQINPNNPKYKLLVTIWKKLPILIANRIGPEVVKNIP